MPDNQNNNDQLRLTKNQKLRLVVEEEGSPSNELNHKSNVDAHSQNQADEGELAAQATYVSPRAVPDTLSTKVPQMGVIHRPMDAQSTNAHRREDDGDNDVRSSPAIWLIVASFIFLLSFVIWSGWQDLNPETKPAQAAGLLPANHASAKTASPKTLEIKKIRPGMRVQAFNPEVTDEERAAWRQADFKNWFELSILLIDHKGKPIYVDLIRPASWVIGLDAQEGKQVWLELEELNGRGWGRVMKLRRTKPVDPGEGRVVTGVFSHEVSGLINVQVEGLDKPIGVTTNHPFWSEDRQEFVQAGSLQQGERLKAMVGGSDGGIARVTAITPRGPPGSKEVVYNFEVEGEHAYQVTGLGLVVHNTYPKPGQDLFVGSYVKNYLANKAAGIGKLFTGHHVPQVAVLNGIVSRTKGIVINLTSGAKGLHRLTRTFSKNADLGSFKKNLSADLADVRKILIAAGYDKKLVDQQLRLLRKMTMKVFHGKL